MQSLNTSIQALEDLNTTGHQYHAIALNDGKLANNGAEASGIILNKPKSGEAVVACYMGEERYAAGGAIGAGGDIAVTTSGWFKAAASGDHIVGRNRAAVTSGSIGIGLFNFATPIYASESSFVL